MRSLALILSMTAPVPPAHLSFIDGIFFLRPVSGSFLKMMILASCPPNSITDPFRVHALHGQRYGVDFLHELGAQVLGHAVAARARDKHVGVLRREAFNLSVEPL